MIGIISDIHGNFAALREVLKALDGMGVEEVFCLGDVVGYYTQINECCAELRRRSIRCVLGNHDWYLTGNVQCPRSKSVNQCLHYQRRIITPENRDWLASFPAAIFAHDISMVHGGWKNPIDEYLEPTEDYFCNVGSRFLASGHTHLQRLDLFGGKTYCNPGSVGQPRDNDPRAAFATFAKGEFQLHRVEYDIDEVGRLMELAGFSGYYYGCLKAGSRNLQWAAGENPDATAGH